MFAFNCCEYYGKRYPPFFLSNRYLYATLISRVLCTHVRYFIFRPATRNSLRGSLLRSCPTVLATAKQKNLPHLMQREREGEEERSVSFTRQHAFSCENLISNASVCSIIECIRSRLKYLNANQSDEVTKSVAILLNSMQIAHAILWRIHLSRSYYYYSLTLLTVCLWAFPVNWIRLWFTHNWYCLIPGLLGNAP